MKTNTSLQDERLALLEQIHASRMSYRRMLTETDKPESTPQAGRVHNIVKRNGSSRTNAINWVTKHPYLSIAAASALIFMGQRIVRTAVKRKNASSLHSEPAQRPGTTGKSIPARRSTDRIGQAHLPALAAKPSRIAAAFTGLATVAAMVLRDPAKMRVATRMFSIANSFVQQRRHRQR
jgi:hypothetical protein